MCSMAARAMPGSSKRREQTPGAPHPGSDWIQKHPGFVPCAPIPRRPAFVTQRGTTSAAGFEQRSPLPSPKALCRGQPPVYDWHFRSASRMAKALSSGTSSKGEILSLICMADSSFPHFYSQLAGWERCKTEIEQTGYNSPTASYTIDDFLSSCCPPL